MAQLLVGLVLFGVSLALLVEAELGLDPWDVLHHGIARTLDVPLGVVVVATSAAVLALWIPIRQRPGIGTALNVVVVGAVFEIAIDVVPDARSALHQAAYLLVGIVVNGAAVGLYVGAGLGPGPRDGLMTGLAARGWPVGRVRTAIEIVVLAVGWSLGGAVGIGTLIYALTIGPLIQLFLPPLTVPSATRSAARPPTAVANSFRPDTNGADMHIHDPDPSGHDGGDASLDPDVLILPASTRTGSVNAALGRLIRDRLGDRAAIVDLDDYDLPIYHGDIEATTGVPDAAVALADRLRAAAVVVIVSPEYNGSFPPLLKNAIDWATRADRSVLADAKVLLAAATPGRSGGGEVLAMLRMWMGHMRVELAGSDLGVARAGVEQGRLVGLTDAELDGFLDQVPCLAPCA